MIVWDQLVRLARAARSRAAAYDLPRRRRVWSVLVDFLQNRDTESGEPHGIAMRLFTEGYSWQEIEAICMREVAPALLESSAPQNAGIEWLGPRILALTSRPEHDDWLIENRERLQTITGPRWSTVRKHFKRLQAAKHFGGHAAFRR
jgi:hypothetical protein